MKPEDLNDRSNVFTDTANRVEDTLGLERGKVSMHTLVGLYGTHVSRLFDKAWDEGHGTIERDELLKKANNSTLIDLGYLSRTDLVDIVEIHNQIQEENDKATKNKKLDLSSVVLEDPDPSTIGTERIKRALSLDASSTLLKFIKEHKIFPALDQQETQIANLLFSSDQNPQINNDLEQSSLFRLNLLRVISEDPKFMPLMDRFDEDLTITQQASDFLRRKETLGNNLQSYLQNQIEIEQTAGGLILKVERDEMIRIASSLFGEERRKEITDLLKFKKDKSLDSAIISVAVDREISEKTGLPTGTTLFLTNFGQRTGENLEYGVKRSALPRKIVESTFPKSSKEVVDASVNLAMLLEAGAAVAGIGDLGVNVGLLTMDQKPKIEALKLVIEWINSHPFDLKYVELLQNFADRPEEILHRFKILDDYVNKIDNTLANTQTPAPFERPGIKMIIARKRPSIIKAVNIV